MQMEWQTDQSYNSLFLQKVKTLNRLRAVSSGAALFGQTYLSLFPEFSQ